MVSILWSGENIECKLPITMPTSKVRVKRDGIYPVATTKEILTEQDYIEWQISYLRGDELIEFGEILKIAFERCIVTKDDIESLFEHFKEADTFEEKFRINRSTTNETFRHFKIIYEKTPILRREFDDGCYIDIVLRHKQRAVGYQAMVYIYVPLKNTQPCLIGSRAQSKQMVKWVPRREHVLGLLEAFLVASKKHKEDMVKKIKPKVMQLD